MAAINRTSQGLRDVLFEEMEALRNGGTPAQAIAVAMLAKQIISTARVEMEYHRMSQEYADKGRTLQIGMMPLGRPTEADAVSAGQLAAALTQEYGPPS